MDSNIHSVYQITFNKPASTAPNARYFAYTSRENSHNSVDALVRVARKKIRDGSQLTSRLEHYLGTWPLLSQPGNYTVELIAEYGTTADAKEEWRHQVSHSLKDNKILVLNTKGKHVYRRNQ